MWGSMSTALKTKMIGLTTIAIAMILLILARTKVLALVWIVRILAVRILAVRILAVRIVRIVRIVATMKIATTMIPTAKRSQSITGNYVVISTRRAIRVIRVTNRPNTTRGGTMVIITMPRAARVPRAPRAPRPPMEASPR